MGQQVPGATGADHQPEDAADDGRALRADAAAAGSESVGEEQERACSSERDGQALGDRPRRVRSSWCLGVLVVKGFLMIAADTKLETPEGPLTIKTVGASPTSVMTVMDDKSIRFALSTDERKVADAQPVLRITLENGRAMRIAPQQVLLKQGFVEARAGDVRAGDELMNAFSFPEGYEYRTDAGEKLISNGTVKVTAVEPGGEADLYCLKVVRSGRFVFSSGVVGKAEV